MGIRFPCPHCGHGLNVKNFLAGKLGRCPACRGQIRVPLADSSPSPPPQIASQSPGEPLGQDDRHHPEGFSQMETEPPPPGTIQGDLDQVEDESPSWPAVERSGASTDATDSALTPTASNLSGQPLQPPSIDAAGAPPPRIPAAIGQAPDATWYVRSSSGNQYGPADSASLAQWLNEGRIGREWLVWCDAWPDWQPAQVAFADLFDTTGTTSGAMRVAAEGDQSGAPATLAPSGQRESLGKRQRQARRQSRRRRHILLVVALLVLFCVLLAALIAVVLRQSSTA